MFKVSNLNSPMKTIHGKEFTGEDNRFRFFMASACGNARRISGVEKLRAHKLGLSLLEGTEDSKEIEDQDADVLKKSIEEVNFSAEVYSQLIESISPVVSDSVK